MRPALRTAERKASLSRRTAFQLNTELNYLKFNRHCFNSSSFCNSTRKGPHAARRAPTSNRYFSRRRLGSSGSRTSVTNALSQTTVTAKNVQGLVSLVTNALGKSTSYVYDAYGDLTTVTDPLGNQITNSYDLRGNKLSAKDPDLGLWTYSYDALGELLTQTDAKGQTTSFVNPDGSAGYDLLGRPTGRAASDQTDGWTYDTAANGKGLIASASGSNAGYGRTYIYDSLSRPTKVTITASGKSYAWNRTYNSDGRIDTLVYPYGLTVKTSILNWASSISSRITAPARCCGRRTCATPSCT